jgi:hypothetical protein
MTMQSSRERRDEPRSDSEFKFEFKIKRRKRAGPTHDNIMHHTGTLRTQNGLILLRMNLVPGTDF